jgi:hypothetical protein
MEDGKLPLDDDELDAVAGGGDDRAQVKSWRQAV